MHVWSYSFTADASNLLGPLPTQLAMKVKTQIYFSSEVATSLVATVTSRVSLFTIYMGGGLPFHQSLLIPFCFKDPKILPQECHL